RRGVTASILPTQDTVRMKKVSQKTQRAAKRVGKVGPLTELPATGKVKAPMSLISWISTAVLLVPPFSRLMIHDSLQEVSTTLVEEVITGQTIDVGDRRRGGRQVIRQESVTLVVSGQPLPRADHRVSRDL